MSRFELDTTNVIGTKKGKWTILEEARVSSGPGYKCRCDCGTERIIARSELFFRGNVQCMACYKKERRTKTKIVSRRSLWER